MRMLACVPLLLLAGFFIPACGQAPRADPVLPAPRPAPAQPLPAQPLPPGVLPPPIAPIVSPYARPDPMPQVGYRSVWQMYWPDRFGRMRPRVVYSPYSYSYHQRDGSPFPWVTTIPRYYLQFTID